MTGTEAISNGIPAFKPPEPRNAAQTLVTMAVILGDDVPGPVVPDRRRRQIIPTRRARRSSRCWRTRSSATAPLYYVVQVSAVLILVLAANTAYADFPRLASLLARDNYAPQTARLSRRAAGVLERHRHAGRPQRAADRACSAGRPGRCCRCTRWACSPPSRCRSRAWSCTGGASAAARWRLKAVDQRHRRHGHRPGGADRGRHQLHGPRPADRAGPADRLGLVAGAGDRAAFIWLFLTINRHYAEAERTRRCRRRRTTTTTAAARTWSWCRSRA